MNSIEPFNRWAPTLLHSRNPSRSHFWPWRPPLVLPNPNLSPSAPFVRFSLSQTAGARAAPWRRWRDPWGSRRLRGSGKPDWRCRCIRLTVWAPLATRVRETMSWAPWLASADAAARVPQTAWRRDPLWCLFDSSSYFVHSFSDFVFNQFVYGWRKEFFFVYCCGGRQRKHQVCSIDDFISWLSRVSLIWVWIWIRGAVLIQSRFSPLHFTCRFKKSLEYRFGRDWAWLVAFIWYTWFLCMWFCFGLIWSDIWIWFCALLGTGLIVCMSDLILGRRSGV